MNHEVRKLTSFKISEDVVALFGKRGFVDSVPNISGFEQIGGVFSSAPTIRKSVQVAIEPVDQIGTCLRTRSEEARD